MAYPALAKPFTFEAARKATTVADYAQARDLLQPLLAGDPFNPEYLAAVADTYALARTMPRCAISTDRRSRRSATRRSRLTIGPAESPGCAAA